MKIGIDVSQSIYGTGVSDYTINLVSALKQLDSENKYVLFGSSLRRSSELKSLYPDATIYHFPPMFLSWLWNNLHQVPIENFIGKVDVFHSSDWTQPPSHAAAVTTVHDLSPILFPAAMSSGLARNISSVHQARLKWVAKDCQKIICVSHSTAEDFQTHFKVNSDRIEVIYEALPDRWKIKPGNDQINQVKRKYGLDNYIFTIGTPNPRKNIRRLISAFENFKIKYRLPEKLVIVGGGGWGNTHLGNYPDIVFTGYLPDSLTAALFSGSQVFIYPSLYEGFGLPLLQAFNYRIPSVVSDRSALPEIAGSAAILINPENEESIAAGISQALKDKEKLISAGEKRLLDFSWENTSARTLSVYNQLCS